MLLRKGCLLVVSCVALAAGVGCSPQAPPPNPTTAKVTAGVVFHAKASAATTKRSGITRWHAIIEKGTGGIVMDGSDAKGKVKFVTSMRVDRKDNTVHFETYAPSRGSLVVDLKTGIVKSNTIPQKEWAGFVSMMRTDWDAHSKMTAYSAWGYVAAAAAIVTGAVLIAGAISVAPIAAGAVLVTVGIEGAATGALAVVGGIATAIDTYKNDAESTAKEAQTATDNAARDAQIQQLQQAVQDLKAAQDKANPPAKEDPAADPAKDPSADPAKDPSADPAKDPSADPAKDPSADPSSTPAADPSSTPSADPAPSADPPASSDPPQAQSLPADNAGGNLDTGGGLDTSSGTASNGGSTGSDTTGGSTGSDTSASNDGTGSDTSASTGGSTGSDTSASTGGSTGSDTSGGDTGSTGGDSTGGDSTGGGDTGGGEFAVGVCRRVAQSKTTKLRACTHY